MLFLLIHDNITGIEFRPQDLQNLVDDLTRMDYEPYITSVGGSGLGILSPYPEHRNLDVVPSVTRTHEPSGQVTPPETPLPESQVQLEHFAATQDIEGAEATLRAPFETISLGGLPGWASGLGRWLYV